MRFVVALLALLPEPPGCDEGPAECPIPPPPPRPMPVNELVLDDDI